MAKPPTAKAKCICGARFFPGIADAYPGFAQDTNTQSTQEQAAPAIKHYDFEDDQVEGDLQRPDGELVTSIQEAKRPSLIEIRRSFLPEITKDFENL